jgi:redox-sensing transcriptional repressor
VSSSDLAVLARVTPAKVRKDLSCLGSYGVRGVGYSVAELRAQIRRALGLTEEVPVIVVGAGNLGRALAGYGGFGDSGFVIVGLFDSDPGAVGSPVGDLVVEPVGRLVDAARTRGAAIGVIATPAGAAQQVADLLVASGIASILNFAPTVIRVPDGVEVRRVDLATELQVLSYYLHRESGADPGR